MLVIPTAVSESIALVIQSEWLSWEGKTSRDVCTGTVENVLRYVRMYVWRDRTQIQQYVE
jgi:hypothetical protein